MKIKLKHILVVAIPVSLLLSCAKSTKEDIPLSPDLDNSSMVQLFLGTVNASRNIILMDGKRILSGAATVKLASGSAFPTATYPSTLTAYAFAVPGGVHTFTVMDTLVTTTQKPLTFANTFEAKKHYTIFMYDTITSPKQVTVETNIEIPTDNSARLRFANLIHDVNAVPAVEVFSRRRNEVLFTNINRTDVTQFIPYSSTVNDTLDIRPVGSATLLARFINFFPAEKRSYTLVYRGSHRGTKVATVFANY